MNLNVNPTVRKLREYGALSHAESPLHANILDSRWLRRFALDCGADGAELVDIERREIHAQRAEIHDRESIQT